MVARLKQDYTDRIAPALLGDLNLENPMQVPRIQKVVINIGMGEALTNSNAIDAATRDLATITGQKPVVTRAKKSVANFRLREG
jgi:large subunit ribosomal protein L5